MEYAKAENRDGERNGEYYIDEKWGPAFVLFGVFVLFIYELCFVRS